MALQLVVENKMIIGINQEALEEWKAYREEDLKKPLTPRAEKMVIKKMLRWDESEQMRMVEEAICNNWRSLYYVEPPKQASTKSTSLQQDLTDTSWAQL